MGRLVDSQICKTVDKTFDSFEHAAAAAARNKVGMWVDWWVVKTLSFFWFKHRVRNQKQSCYVGRLLGCQKSQFENVFTGLSAAGAAGAARNTNWEF